MVQTALAPGAYRNRRRATREANVEAPLAKGGKIWMKTLDGADTPWLVACLMVNWFIAAPWNYHSDCWKLLH
jgi:hypothetical protein